MHATTETGQYENHVTQLSHVMWKDSSAVNFNKVEIKFVFIYLVTETVNQR